MDTDTALDIAIVGMECRFPGARNVHEFWQNLTDGRESISAFTDERYLAAGGAPAALDDRYLVKAEAAIEGIDLFDADFFGYPPAEAALIDPQHRLFLECAYHALENAAHDPGRFAGSIGVYAGAGQSRYFLRNVYPHLMDDDDSIALQHAMLGSAGSTLATRTSYHLGLTGPSVGVQAACSTSLVAVHLAAADLLGYRCDLALAGGATLNPTPARGYRYVEDGPFSPDGHCRAFDAHAAGMVPGDGVGVVVLKRLEDALADGDHVHAVIKGSAVNNDGRRKLGFTAPSVPGQADVIAAAQAMAGIGAASLGYVEAHGTGTPMGDPIEVSALSRVFAEDTERKQYCALGSVKTNIGHTDAAAGVAGLIKAALAVRNGQIPPTLHFTEPNPLLNLEDTPFYVNSALTPWPASSGPRRAAVNSLGIGGTNAHVIVEQAPPRTTAEPARRWSLLTLSAKTGGALAAMSATLGEHLRENPERNLADVAYTLQVGRPELPYRHTVRCRTTEEAANQLLADAVVLEGGAAAETGDTARPVVFLFPGAGTQYLGMGRELYETEPVFRAEIDRCAEIVSAELGEDLRTALYGAEAGDAETANELVGPLLLSTEYALAKLLMSFGIEPNAAIGHSVGEYTAACLSGVLSLEDALPLVVRRDRLMHRAAGTGGMLSVATGEAKLRGYLSARLTLAAVNGPAACVVSGPSGELLVLREKLIADGVDNQPVVNPAAGHSVLLEPVLDEFADAVSKVRLGEPRLRYLSNVTGTWIQPGEATDPEYWVRHFRETVRFSDGIDELLRDSSPILIEVGPGRVLSKLAGSRPDRAVTSFASMRHAKAAQSDTSVLLDLLGGLWREGMTIDWAATHAGTRRARVPLPCYPFERRRYWIDAPKSVRAAEPPAAGVDWSGAAANEMAEAEQRLRAAIEVRRTPARLQAQLDELCLRYVCEYLRDNGISTAAGASYPMDELLARLRVLPKYRKLLVALLKILDEESVTTTAGDRITFEVDAASLGESSVLEHRISARFPDYLPDLAFVGNAVRHYRQVFQGELEGNEVLMPEGNDEAQRALIDKRLSSSDILVYRELIADTVAKLVSGANGRKIRILEVGAGRGYLSWVAAEALAETTVEYHFTDVGRSFVLDGQRQAAERGLDFLRFGVLDVGRDPEPQGYRAGTFDIVLAFNVLHAVPDLRQAVRNVTRLLAPCGALFALEACVQQRWSLMYTGLYDGWWYFDDDVRDESPLMSAQRWVDLLREEGYREVVDLPRDPGTREAADHVVIIGQVPPATGGSLVTSTDPPAPKAAALSSLGAATSFAFNRRPLLETDYVAPAAGTEEEVAGIWREVLGLDRVGVHDNFFDLGGESLLAMQIVARVRDHTKADLSLRTLFDNPTIAGLVAALAGRGPGRPPENQPAIKPSSRRTRGGGADR